jgi:hypothetical protein
VTYVVKKSWVKFVLATTLLGLTGCADNNNAVNDNNALNDNNAGNMGVNNVRNNTNNGVNGRNVSNQNLRVSSRAVRNVESLKEVDQAHVVIRNNDAYVAVRLNNTNNTNTNTNQNRTRANGGTIGTAPKMNASYGNGYNSGTTTNNVTNGTNGTTSNGTTGYRNTTNNAGTNGTNASINRTNDINARGTNSLERKITNQVRAADRTIDNVHVSFDTDTFGQMTNYSNDIRTGTNRNGLWNDFTNSVNRMFR